MQNVSMLWVHFFLQGGGLWTKLLKFAICAPGRGGGGPPHDDDATEVAKFRILLVETTEAKKKRGTLAPHESTTVVPLWEGGTTGDLCGKRAFKNMFIVVYSL